MLNWSTYPFLRILLVFIGGILTVKYANWDVLNFLSLPHLILLFLAVCLTKAYVKKAISSAVCGCLLLVIVFLVGFIMARSDHQALNKNIHRITQAYVGTIASFPNNKEKHWTYELEVSQTIERSKNNAVSHRVLLYQKKSESTHYVPRYGDVILVEGSPQLIPTAKNPYTFDFSAYMASRNVFFQHFVYDHQIKWKAKDRANPLLSRVYKLRSYFEHKIESHIHQKKEQAIVKALLLGIKGQLDNETKGAYAAAGAMHVLAVSGLHVSVIYFIVQWIFGRLSPVSARRVISPLLSIATLWVYALLTGFSPSILRAVTMFTVIVLAQILKRRTNVFNSLSLAAFILLLYKPGFLFDVGYQLSFLAVAGILYFHPKISALWAPKAWLANKIWQLTSVSIAAQLSTFPLGLYYFHQFPSYFLVSNLVVIPLSFAIMVLGILLLGLGHWFGFVGWLLEQTVHLLNGFVSRMQDWNGSVIENIVVSPFQVMSIYVMLLACFALFQYRKPRYMYIIVLAALMISFEQSRKLIDQISKNQILFYSSKGSLLIDKVSGLKAQLSSPDSSLNTQVIDRVVMPFRRQCHLPSAISIEPLGQKLADFARFEVFGQTKILWIYQPFSLERIQSPLDAHIVVVSDQSVRSIKELRQLVNCHKVILDTSNGYVYKKLLMAEGQSLNLEVLDLSTRHHMVSLSGDQVFLNMFF